MLNNKQGALVPLYVGQKYQDDGTTTTTIKQAKGWTSVTGTLHNMTGCSTHRNT
jgi:hypothetical protein